MFTECGEIRRSLVPGRRGPILTLEIMEPRLAALTTIRRRAARRLRVAGTTQIFTRATRRAIAAELLTIRILESWPEAARAMPAISTAAKERQTAAGSFTTPTPTPALRRVRIIFTRA